MDKKSLSERDICTKFITPALESAGWDNRTQLREEVSLTAGRVEVRGKMAARVTNPKAKGGPKRADYVLYFKPGIPLAVVEAKDNHHKVHDGIQQAIDYSDMLQVPFAFSSNGDGFVFHDKTAGNGVIETNLTLEQFPSPEQLWLRYAQWRGFAIEQSAVVTQDYHVGKTPRYYQLNAINRTIEAIAKGQNRLLLVMATGTGKNYTAFQIIWRLWKSKAKKRILFLADRNILVDQTMVNDFKPFKGAMAKLSPNQKGIENVETADLPELGIDKRTKQVDKSYEIYLSLYQTVVGREGLEDIYKQFSPDFFDLIVIDECHRGSAAEDSAWRAILDYFTSATHLGLTATPKETKEVSNITYFGEPIYTYSLKQGIDDGFLAPYKVIRVHLDKDLEGWRPESGKRDDDGNLIDDRIYNQADMNRTLVLKQRDITVAKQISEYLRAVGRMSKTIVFCEDIDHAARMRQALINENVDLVSKHPKYVMQITGDNEQGKLELDNFIDPEKPLPVIATTSKLMTTGIDAQTCKLVVLDRTINSMTEFKQIIGRGTRINEEHGKLWFTIIDFKKATELFADPAFDGEPVVIFEPEPNAPITPPEPVDPTDYPPQSDDDNTSTGPSKFRVSDVKVRVIGKQVQYIGSDGKLITESLQDHTRKTVLTAYASLDAFLRQWNRADKKQAIIDELQQSGVMFDALAEDVGRDIDAFDLICHVVFGQKPLTRRERALNVKKRNYFSKYGDTAKKVLEALLDKYADGGIADIESAEVLRLSPISELGSPVEIISSFGGKANYLSALHELESKIFYSSNTN